MRSLKYAILGLLIKSPLTGYDIAREFQPALGSFWNAKHSQIYPELKKLTGESLVEFTTVIQGEKLEKKLYTITEKGRLDFQNWILLDEELEPTPKDVFRLRVFFANSIKDEQLIILFKNQLDKRVEKLARLQQAMNENYKNITFVNLNKMQRGDYFVLRGAILREQNYIEWLQECMNQITTASED